MRTTINTYPLADRIELEVPEWRGWTNQYQRAWNSLDAKYHVSEIRSLQSILASARLRSDYPGGAERAVSEVKSDLIALSVYDRLMSEPKFRSAQNKFVISSIAEELYPILSRVLPPGSETLNFVDYTPSRILKRRERLNQVPAREIPSVLIYTLQDDNIGVLPQLTTHALAELTNEIRARGWAGFSTRYWMPGDQDACVAYLARAAWDSRATPEETYDDQIRHVYGAAAVTDMMTVYREVEAATQTLEWQGLGISYPSPGMIMQHWSTTPLSPELKNVALQYEAAHDAATRALAESQPAGREYARYWVGRLDFGANYMKAIEALRSGAKAEAAGDFAGARRAAESALSLATGAIQAYADVARDRSDKGAIAVMNEYVVRPLRAKAAALKSPANKPPVESPTIRAIDFRRTKVYQSKQRPSSTEWTSFFKGTRPGEWYIGCAEMTVPGKPLPRASRQWVYEMGLPRGYDTSKYLQELVLLKSADSMNSWKVVSREAVTANGGSFGQAISPDRTLHRFVWACYSRDPGVKTSDIYHVSRDGGKTWSAGPTFVSDRFAWYPQRLRTLYAWRWHAC